MSWEHLPEEIRMTTRAVVWRSEQRNGGCTKVPYQPDRPTMRAAVDDPRTWGSFATALDVVAAGRADGAGIVLGDGLVGIDLDHVRDPDAGTITHAAQTIVDLIDSYTEISPSGTGLHVLVRGTLPPGRRRRGWLEMYERARYFTVTGAHVPGTPTTICERTEALRALHQRVFPPPRPVQPLSAVNRGSAARDDATLLARAHAARNGGKFGSLWRGDTSGYKSASEADLALCSMLAYWTDGDDSRIDELFRQSGLMRPKWDRGTPAYGVRTIAMARTTQPTTRQGCSR